MMSLNKNLDGVSRLAQRVGIPPDKLFYCKTSHKHTLVTLVVLHASIVAVSILNAIML